MNHAHGDEPVFIYTVKLPVRRDGPSLVMRVSERMIFTARFVQDAEFAERKYIFFSGERPAKMCSYIMMAVKIVAAHIRTRL